MTPMSSEQSTGRLSQEVGGSVSSGRYLVQQLTESDVVCSPFIADRIAQPSHSHNGKLKLSRRCGAHSSLSLVAMRCQQFVAYARSINRVHVHGLLPITLRRVCCQHLPDTDALDQATLCSH